MKKLRILGYVLFWASLLSIMVSFATACMIGEAEIFDVAGMLRYTWIMWLFIPISIVSAVVGFLLKRRNQKYKKNYVAAFVVIPILLLFGSYGFLFSHIVTYDNNVLYNVAQQTNVDFPQNANVATIGSEEYKIVYVKVDDNAEWKAFVNEVKSNGKWTDRQSSAIGGALPFEVRVLTQNCKCTLFYNKTLDQYNTAPTSSGVYDCVFMAYDEKIGRIIVAFDFSCEVVV